MKRSREGEVEYPYVPKRADRGNAEQKRRLGPIITTQHPTPGQFSTLFSTLSGAERDLIRESVDSVNVTSPLSIPGQLVSRRRNPTSLTSAAPIPSPLPYYVSSRGRQFTRNPNLISSSSRIPNSTPIVPFVSDPTTELVRTQDPYNLTSQLPFFSLGNPTTICKLEGCLKPAHVEGTRVHDYCGMTHYLLGIGQSKPGDGIDNASEKLRKSVSDLKRQKHGNYYSESCNDREGLSHKLPIPVDPVIKYVCRITKATRDQYQRLTSQFLSNWVKGDPPPKEYISVYMITNAALEQKWRAYKKQLHDTTIERYYHGTKLCCDISSLQLCSNRSCGICGITQNGFDKSLIGTNISRFKRFGKAFYLAPHSSKCHDYTVGHGQHRAILCFQVFPGKKYKLKKTDVNFTLPSEYDSAYGEAGQDLNYPELMLYSSAAALPFCIFTYKKDGIRQIAR